MIIVEWSTFEVSHAMHVPNGITTTTASWVLLAQHHSLTIAMLELPDGCLTTLRCWAADDDSVVRIATRP